MNRQTTTRRRHGVRRMSERKRLTITAITAVSRCAGHGRDLRAVRRSMFIKAMSASCPISSETWRRRPELDAEPSITSATRPRASSSGRTSTRARSSGHRQTVAFVVSLGPKEQPAAPEDTPVAIPSFVGLTLEQAQATAKSPGVTVEAGGTVYDDNVRKRSVARQNPVGGTMVKPGTTIQVPISAGPEIHPVDPGGKKYEPTQKPHAATRPAYERAPAPDSHRDHGDARARHGRDLRTVRRV